MTSGAGAHTPGPWRHGSMINGRTFWADAICAGGFEHEATRIASVYSIPINCRLEDIGADEQWQEGLANAERIVACVNACEQFEDPAEAIRLLGIEAAKAGAVDALRLRVEKLEAALRDQLADVRIKYLTGKIL